MRMSTFLDTFETILDDDPKSVRLLTTALYISLL